MKLSVQRLILAAALFLGWLGYLSYLVICRPHTPAGLLGAFEGRPLTLSRPQFLVSTLDVVAEVSGEKGEKVIVKQVLFPKTNAPVQPGQEIHVKNIDRCRPLSDPNAKNTNPSQDYSGPGKYLLALQPIDPNDKQRYQIVPTPPSPGFPSPPGAILDLPRLYPASEEMLAEYREIKKP